MTYREPLADYLTEPSRNGDEISITGKWVPSKPGGRFRTTEESREMLREWEDIHQGARADTGVLSTEINHAVGEDAVLVHHVFANPDALVDYLQVLQVLIPRIRYGDRIFNHFGKRVDDRFIRCFNNGKHRILLDID